MIAVTTRFLVRTLTAILLVPLAATGAPQPDLAGIARALVGPDQGIYVETADGTVLLAQLASKPVHPASVSKVPTALALLRKLGPEHRFVTTFSSSGRIAEGTLYGDLVVQGDGDPSLVDEDALLVAERLKDRGIKRVAGNLRLLGPLTFDWQNDGEGSLRKALSGQTPRAAWSAVRELEVTNTSELTRASLTPPGIQFILPTASATVSADLRPLVIHRSQPLLSLVKALNDYSNNIIKPFADSAGGPAVVESVARSAVPEVMRGEITLGDGAGTDPANRLSPRAAVKLLRALEVELAQSGHALFDILPVAGVDTGTLLKRLSGPDEAGRVVGKTGTYDSYGASALIGAIPTSDRGTVYFAILNHGVPVPQARRRQDSFVRALLLQLHSLPWQYQRDDRPAITRAEVLQAPR